MLRQSEDSSEAQIEAGGVRAMFPRPEEPSNEASGALARLKPIISYHFLNNEHLSKI